MHSAECTVASEVHRHRVDKRSPARCEHAVQARLITGALTFYYKYLPQPLCLRLFHVTACLSAVPAFFPPSALLSDPLSLSLRYHLSFCCYRQLSLVVCLCLFTSLFVCQSFYCFHVSVDHHPGPFLYLSLYFFVRFSFLNE